MRAFLGGEGRFYFKNNNRGYLSQLASMEMFPQKEKLNLFFR
jgi:hypothetical protein